MVVSKEIDKEQWRRNFRGQYTQISDRQKGEKRQAKERKEKWRRRERE